MGGWLLFFGQAFAGMAQSSPWTNALLTAEERAGLLFTNLTLDEKLLIVHGCPGPYVGNSTNLSRLGIPGLHLADGPAGVADWIPAVTVMPAPIALAASFDTALARQYGTAIGAEGYGKGVHVLLGPMINLVRVSQGGRDFEMFGEDPCLTSAMAVSHLLGIQSQGVMATAKHFICNDQETTRGNEDSIVDERTLQEIYFPPFLASVRAGAGSACSAYNAINGSWASESPLLKTVLKGAWNFKGFVMCDWGANFGTEGAATNGLDLEMPSGTRFGAPLKGAIQNGTVPAAQLDEMVLRILTAMFRFGIFDHPSAGTLTSTVTNAAHTQLARDVAAQGMVLLQNRNNCLPLNSSSLRSIAVVGSAGWTNPIWVGTGSAQCAMAYYDTPLDGMRRRAGGRVAVAYNQGDGGHISEAVALARQSDVAIVCVGEQTGEGKDRASLSLPADQDALVSAVAAVNAKTVVVLYEGAGTLMPWISQVAAVVVAWYPGQEGANALASVLFGDVNPSGKLPVTFAVSSNQVPAHSPAQFPGTNLQVCYSEGLCVGYRWYDASNIAPLFPFGFGLSYTTFGYSNLTVSALSAGGQINVSVDVFNSGARPGSEVAQLYLGFPSAAQEPPRSLKGFQKVSLQPGQTQRVSFGLGWEDLAYWNTNSSPHGWGVSKGTYPVWVGGSSRDLRLSGSFTITSTVPASGRANLALFAPVSSSSVLAANTPATAAVDGDLASGWASSDSSPQWLTVDLGAVTNISRLRLVWNTNYAQSYQVRVSANQSGWTTCSSVNAGSGGVEDIFLRGGGRYVQVYMTQKASGPGYGLQEVEVFGEVPGNADTNAPSAMMTAPGNNSTVTGAAVLVSAAASDDVAVAGVQFELDGLGLGSAVLAAPYNLVWDSTTCPNGPHRLSAVATDTSGNQVQSAAVTVTVSNGGSFDTAVWVDDSIPAGAMTGADGGDAWTWGSSNPAPFSGSRAHRSSLAGGEHQHFFYGVSPGWKVQANDILFAYVYLDPANPPSEVMLQWNDGSWEHRAFWGDDRITFGIPNSPGSRCLGSLPATGQWIKLSVAAGLVGLEGSTVTGMAFTLYDGQATWDCAGLCSGLSPAAFVGPLRGGFSNGSWQVRFTSNTNWLYTLQRSTNLLGWRVVSGAMQGSGGQSVMSDNNAPGGSCFYRISAVSR